MRSTQHTHIFFVPFEYGRELEVAGGHAERLCSAGMMRRVRGSERCLSSELQASEAVFAKFGGSGTTDARHFHFLHLGTLAQLPKHATRTLTPISPRIMTTHFATVTRIVCWLPTPSIAETHGTICERYLRRISHKTERRGLILEA